MKHYGAFRKAKGMRRAPHGARELKLLLPRRADEDVCRAPHGARELKHPMQRQTGARRGGRAPHGARELKRRRYRFALRTN